MDIKRTAAFIKAHSLPAFRTKQIADAVYKNYVPDWDGISALPADLREELKKTGPLSSLKTLEALESKKGDAIKFCFKLKDGLLIETVLLNMLSGKWSLCVSTQAGCPVRCLFCATGRRGLKRNLSPEEISDQFLEAGAWLKKRNGERVSSVIFMGMGEPFLNYDAVHDAIKTISGQEYFGLGQRHISVSTAGHVPGIRRFAKDFPQANLAVSLHAAEDPLRDKLVPLNKRYPLDQLSKAIKDYILSTKRRVLIEYVMLSGVNDTQRWAKKLVDWLRAIESPKYFNINLISYNKTGAEWRPPTAEHAKLFANQLISMGMSVTIRKSLGADISGACGQLAARVNKRESGQK